MAAISKDVRRMLGLSLHGWEDAMVVLLIIAGFAAFAAGVATWAVVRLQRIELTNSEREFAKYKLDTAKEISDANARAAEAQLELEKFKQPRSLSKKQIEAIVWNLMPFQKTPFDLSVVIGDTEAIRFLEIIANTLQTAGWTWVEYNHPHGPLMNVYRIAGKPNIGQQGWEAVSVQVFPDHEAQLSKAADALVEALNAEGVIATRDKANDAIPNHDTIHVLVGRKPM